MRDHNPLDEIIDRLGAQVGAHPFEVVVFTRVDDRTVPAASTVGEHRASLGWTSTWASEARHRVVVGVEASQGFTPGACTGR